LYNFDPDAKSSPLDVTVNLLQEVASAILVCVGFNDYQKGDTVQALHQNGYSGIATGEGANLRLGGQHQFCTAWPFYSLSVKPGVASDLLRYYALMLHTATIDPNWSVADDLHPMGLINPVYPTNWENSTLTIIALCEFDFLKRVLSRYLHHHHHQGNQPMDYGNDLPIGPALTGDQIDHAIYNGRGQLYTSSGGAGSVAPSPVMSEDGFSQASSTSTL
jgi:hypothetical protein